MSVHFSSKTVVLTAAAASIAATSLGFYIWKEEQRSPVLEVYVFPLARGQSIFIRTPDDTRILIGGGNNSEVVRHISRHLPFYSRRIDMLVAGVEDGSAIGGLIDVAERYEVEKAVVPLYSRESIGLSSTTDAIFKELLATLKKRDVALVRMRAGDTMDLGDMTMRAVFPASPEAFVYSKASAPELILDIVYGKTEFLIHGKTTRKIQKHIAGLLSDSYTSVIISANNGSPDSLSAELLDAVKPEHYVYSREISYSTSRQASSAASGINIREHEYLKFVSDGEEVALELP